MIPVRMISVDRNKEGRSSAIKKYIKAWWTNEK
jgi:hypothetical protein